MLPQDQSFLITDFLLYGAPLDEDFAYNECPSLQELLRGQEQQQDVATVLSRFDQIFASYIQQKLEGRRRVGILLSGGIDSANILAYLLRYLDSGSVFCYTWGGWGESSSDVQFAKVLAKAYHIKHHRIILPTADYEQEALLLRKAIQKTKRPLDHSHAIPYMLLLQAIKRDGVDLVFNGQNADTLFMAYPAPQKVYAVYRIARFLLPKKRVYPLFIMQRFKSGGVWRFVRRSALSPSYRERLWQLLAKIDRLPINLQQKIIVMEELYTEARYCQNHQKILLEAFGVEVANPYYSRDFITTALWISPAFRKRNRFNKWLLYRFAEQNNIPPAIIHRPKKGLSYGYTTFIAKGAHLPLWERIKKDDTLNKFVDTLLAHQKARDNFFVLDRLRSALAFIQEFL
jgi:asparagine synthetase B (glutamine-hydrolysing)